LHRCAAALALAALTLAAASPAAAWTAAPGPAPARALPENAEARAALRETIFAPVRQAAAARDRVIEQPSGGSRVRFSAQLQDGAVFLVFQEASRPASELARPGTFIIKRSLKDGSFLQAKVFLQADAGTFLRLEPAAGGTRATMNVWLRGSLLHRDIAVPVPFQGLLTSPVARIIEITTASVDWQLVLPPPRTDADARLSAVVAEIRRRLPLLGDAEDGAMDRSGRFVLIADSAPQAGAPGRLKGADRKARPAGGFNCSGFAKWVIDGFYAPLTGALTDIASLKQRGLEERGNRWSAAKEESRDPYFGLDWSRNLARALAQARSGTLPGAEELDERDAELFPYVEDVGFPVENLALVLTVLARRDPGTFYLGSVNSPAPPGSGPGGLRQHHHVVVLFPFVDAGGTLRLVVMERNAESSTASLAARYPGSSVHLVRVGSEGAFALPSVE
jgi:hypothetical protein